MPTNNTPDNWATFRRLLQQQIELTKASLDVWQSLLEEGDHADHLDFIDQLKFDDADIISFEAAVTGKEPKYRMAKVPNRNRKWSTQDHTDLSVLFNYGLTDEQIAEMMGRSVRSVQQKRYQLGLRRDV